MKKLIPVWVAAIAVMAITMSVTPLAVASASGQKTIHKPVSLSGGQSVTVTCSGKSLSVTKSGDVAVLVCADAAAEECSAGR
jgi:hypothetical protein